MKTKNPLNPHFWIGERILGRGLASRASTERWGAVALHGRLEESGLLGLVLEYQVVLAATDEGQSRICTEAFDPRMRPSRTRQPRSQQLLVVWLYEPVQELQSAAAQWMEFHRPEREWDTEKDLLTYWERLPDAELFRLAILEKLVQAKHLESRLKQSPFTWWSELIRGKLHQQVVLEVEALYLEQAGELPTWWPLYRKMRRQVGWDSF